jgi:ribonuclease HI
MDKGKTIICSFDGSGYGGYGFSIKDSKSFYGKIFGATNNKAEYMGLVKLLEYLVSISIKDTDIIICGDSQLVIKQILGEWQVKKEHLKPLHKSATRQITLLQVDGNSIQLKWIPRKDNSFADMLSNLGNSLKTEGLMEFV